MVAARRRSIRRQPPGRNGAASGGCPGALRACGPAAAAGPDPRGTTAAPARCTPPCASPGRSHKPGRPAHRRRRRPAGDQHERRNAARLAPGAASRPWWPGCSGAAGGLPGLSPARCRPRGRNCRRRRRGAEKLLRRPAVDATGLQGATAPLEPAAWATDPDALLTPPAPTLFAAPQGPPWSAAGQRAPRRRRRRPASGTVTRPTPARWQRTDDRRGAGP